MLRENCCVWGELLFLHCLGSWDMNFLPEVFLTSPPSHRNSTFRAEVQEGRCVVQERAGSNDSPVQT